jgi:hypothetical protein
MSNFLRLFTALVLSVHLVMGCCVHHAHGCESMDDSPPQTASLETQCCESSNDSDHGDHGSTKCEGDKCSFLASSLTPQKLHSGPQPSFAVAIVTEPLSSTVLHSAPNFFTTGRLLLPVRLHLANQVLLI